ncbi:MAG: OadG family protein [Saccharofermentanales bacterium]|jgi:sodium pump decarboxylase gamma subunit
MFDFANITAWQAFLLSLFSIVIVFLVLLVISYLIDLVAVAAKRKANKREKDEVANDQAPPPAPAVEDGVSAETVAIIAAALAAYADEDTQLIIRKVERRGAPLTGWEASSIEDSLQRS